MPHGFADLGTTIIGRSTIVCTLHDMGVSCNGAGDIKDVCSRLLCEALEAHAKESLGIESAKALVDDNTVREMCLSGLFSFFVQLDPTFPRLKSID